MEEIDFAFALSLQQELYNEASDSRLAIWNNGEEGSTPQSSKCRSVVDSDWELIDPTPDVLALFQEFNETYFWGRLNMVEVKWSKRMTLCAGLCRYEGFGGLCSIALSQPLLKLRPRKDLVETLLHEMIHAYLFVTQNNKDHDAHGPEFCKHMRRINQIARCNITIYHSFHDEVAEQRKHWWRCQGPCQSRPPYFGYVKRAMNRAPSKNDYWWNDHEKTCGGKYVKIKEPENYGKKVQKISSISESNASNISQMLKQHKPSKANPKSKSLTSPNGNKKPIGNVLGGSRVGTVAGRGIPSTSRLLSTQPTEPLSSYVDSNNWKQNVTAKAEEAQLRSRRLSSQSSNLPSSSPLDPKNLIEDKKHEVRNNEIHDKETNLSRIKKREKSSNDSPVRNKKKKGNLHDFFRQMKKSGRKSVNEGAPVFRSVNPVVSFSKRAVHFNDSEDENSDKENYSRSKNPPESLQRDSRSKQENYEVKSQKGTKHQGDRVSVNLLDFIDDDILYDELDHTSGIASPGNPPVKVKIEVSTEKTTATGMSGNDLVKIKKENSASNWDDDFDDNVFRSKSKKSKNRLPSFSDDDDETLTQVWRSHVDSKKLKSDSGSDDEHVLPVFSMNGISIPSHNNNDSCKTDFTSKFIANDKLLSEKCNDNTLSSEKSEDASCEITSQFKRDHCEGGAMHDKESLNTSIHGSSSQDLPGSSHVSCPICGLMCSDDNIIQHVDDCLTSDESHGTSQNTVPDVSKGKVMNFPTSVWAYTSTSSNCDSKTSPDAASALSDDKIHAASNNSDCVPGPSSSTNKGDTSNVSCPICGISCSAEEINYHVDECLSLKAINESGWD